MQTSEIIRAAIPGADESLCDYVLWERTPYPFASLTAKDIYRAARRLQRAQDAGKRLCDLCDRVAVQGYTCARCMGLLLKIRRGREAEAKSCI